MVFVMVKKAYTGKTAGQGRRHCLIGLGLTAMVIVYMIVGAFVFMELTPTYESQGIIGVENETTFLDAVYFMIVTLTTVGFGDVAPVGDSSKIFLSVYILLSLILTGVLLEVTDFLFQIDVLELEEGDEEEERKFWSPARKKFFFSIVVVILVMIAAALFFCLYEDFTIVNAIYFSVVTLSTVGYGDITPKTTSGKLFSIFWIGVGVIALFRCIGALMDLMLEARKKAWAEHRNERTARVARHLSTRVGHMQMGNISDTEAIKQCTKQELVDALIRMEYVVYKLQQKGNVTLEELRDLNTEYKALTVDEVEAEFSMKSTSMVFNAIAGNNPANSV